jgi:hypothetical protein
MIAAIEQVQGETRSINDLAAWFGFRELGYELLHYEQGAVHTLATDPEIVVVGGIASVWRALTRLGAEIPRLDSIPPPVEPFAGRRLWMSTLGQVRADAERQTEPVFVKPLPGDLKQFTGRVVRHFRDLIPMAGLPDEMQVQCSEVVEFISEYRNFVHRGELVGSRNYKGDFRVCPDYARVDEAVAAFADAPVAYSLDTGITRDGRTLVVEANDGYSLGFYGLHPVRYARMLQDRWSQMTAAVAV